MNSLKRPGFRLLIAGLLALATSLAYAADPAPATAAATTPAPAVQPAGGAGFAVGGRGGGQNAAQQDRQKMMQLLNITSLRPGKNGSNPQATNAANYDESKANPYPSLPDPLLTNNREKVTTAEVWWKVRRPEIVEFFDREIYGRVPKDMPKVTWEVTSTTEGTNGEIPIVTKQLVGRVDNSSYPEISVNIALTLTVPANAKGPSPIMMVFGGGFGGFGLGGRGGTNALGGTNFAGRGFGAAGGTNALARGGRGGRGPGGGGPDWRQTALSKGWGYAALNPGSIQADNGGGLTQGIIGLMNKGQPRKTDDWGSLRAWAWGASRALDYFETDKSVDAKQVGLTGHSRYGKATIVAMAYDERFAISYVSSSGAGGAKLHRRNWGEIVENVAATSEYHWMAGNFLKYAGPLTWDDMPVDSHQLVALCAPRPIFLSAGATQGDGWVDAKGTFMAGEAAQPVYRLLGKKDMGPSEFPSIETPLIDGEVAFRQHAGGHTDGPNWPTFFTFADRYIKGPGLKGKE